jgi:hypothetical protein
LRADNDVLGDRPSLRTRVYRVRHGLLRCRRLRLRSLTFPQASLHQQAVRLDEGRVCLPGPVSARKPGAKGPNRTITTRVRSDYPLSNVRRSQRARRSELLSSNRPMETRLDRAHRPVARCNPERLAVPSRAEALCGSAGASRRKRPPDRAHFATLAGGSASPTTRSPNRWFLRQRGSEIGLNRFRGNAKRSEEFVAPEARHTDATHSPKSAAVRYLPLK